MSAPLMLRCCWPNIFQRSKANHNCNLLAVSGSYVVVDRIYFKDRKQITTAFSNILFDVLLLLTEYISKIESKSQLVVIPIFIVYCCCWPNIFQRSKANHNCIYQWYIYSRLLLTEYISKIESKSQLSSLTDRIRSCCCWPNIFQRSKANHNLFCCGFYFDALLLTEYISKIESKSQHRNE